MEGGNASLKVGEGKVVVMSLGQEGRDGGVGGSCRTGGEEWGRGC